MTIQQALHSGFEQLINTSDAPELDAQWLLVHVLQKKEASWLFTHQEQKLSSPEIEMYTQCIQGRRGGKPLAYILGSWEFYGREFFVNEHVLVPRPATEELIEKSLDYIRSLRTKLGRPLVIADIGTGSGCIAITLALETESRTLQKIYATDISPAALSVARQNALHYNVTDRIEFLQGDMLEPLKDKQIDLIVSNPPYVPSAELTQQPTVNTRSLLFEPRIALDGGTEGQKYSAQISAPAVVETTKGIIQTL
jgi:release factor glutamine methyltransferase